MNEKNINVLCVNITPANNTFKNKKADIIGILTRENIEAYYRRNI